MSTIGTSSAIILLSIIITLSEDWWKWPKSCDCYVRWPAAVDLNYPPHLWQMLFPNITEHSSPDTLFYKVHLILSRNIWQCYMVDWYLCREPWKMKYFPWLVSTFWEPWKVKYFSWLVSTFWEPWKVKYFPWLVSTFWEPWKVKYFSWLGSILWEPWKVKYFSWLDIISSENH
jgi:hypothetical protein